MQHQAPHPGELMRLLSRRQLLRVGGMGMLGLTLPRLCAAEELAHPRARAKSVIFLFQWGGPTHVDTFDMKPQAPEGIRGPYQPMATSVPGTFVCEHLPRTARIMDKVTVIRSLHHGMKNHNSAGYYALTGHAPPSDDQRLRDSLALYPAFGSVVDAIAPAKEGIPTFVSYPHTIRDGSITPGQHASFLGKAHDPLFFKEDPNDANFRLPELSLPGDLSIDRLHERRSLQKIVDQQSRLLEFAADVRGFDDYYSRAVSMLTSDRVRGAFDLSREPDQVRDRYGRTTYGQGCLLARRLVEAGAKFVTVYFAPNIGGQSKTTGGWDTHGFNDTRMFPIVEARHFPITEQTLPTLLEDLDERGLLDETLVVWMGEFGRTPRINSNVSRDHWPQCYCALLAGGGIKRGYTYGASDARGEYPDLNPVRPDDLAATMYHLLGIHPETPVYDTIDRPLPISAGNPILDILA